MLWSIMGYFDRITKLIPLGGIEKYLLSVHFYDDWET